MTRAAYSIRPIARGDDAAMARIIRSVMPEFGADGPGFAIHDPEVDALSAAYAAPRSRYYVVELGGAVAGGAGVAPLQGGDAATCELRKMYFLPELRGRGAGAELLALCLATARDFGYLRCYLETLDSMQRAQALYRRFGFMALASPLGATGHFGCNRWYLLNLKQKAAHPD